MAYKIEYKSSVFRELKHLDKNAAKRITKEIRESLSLDPNCGEPLTGQFKGMLKLRVGDYRIIYSRTKDGVLILRVGHRSIVYGK
ncbi:MAG: type II toxin-antitoxin system RelE/ParE family toxin [Methanothrix sp.]|nr:MAG: type II toxin-antitoxin system RelE/ParE family toxin [Methanothrix sp.]